MSNIKGQRAPRKVDERAVGLLKKFVGQYSQVSAGYLEHESVATFPGGLNPCTVCPRGSVVLPPITRSLRYVFV